MTTQNSPDARAEFLSIITSLTPEQLATARAFLLSLPVKRPTRTTP